MEVNYSVEGLEGLRHKLNLKVKEFLIAADAGMKKAAFYLESEVKAGIAGRRGDGPFQTKTRGIVMGSVDTGNMMRSVFSKRMGVATYRISNLAPYAIYIESGTKRMKARAHYRKALRRSSKKITEIVNAEIVRAGKKS